MRENTNQTSQTAISITLFLLLLLGTYVDPKPQRVRFKGFEENREGLEKLASARPFLFSELLRTIPPENYSRFEGNLQAEDGTTYKVYFEYPTAYENESYANGCAIRNLDNSIDLGDRTSLSLQPFEGASLQGYVEKIFEENGFKIQDRINTKTNSGQELIKVLYRFGGMDRLGIAGFLKQDDFILILQWHVGSHACLTTANQTIAFEHMGKTISLTRQHDE
jgi:hypothetical protein